MPNHNPLLSVSNLSCLRSEGQTTFSNISFDVYAGDVLVLSGRSGSGKTTLLKCLSHLNIYKGEVLLHGRKPPHYGIPMYRTRVLYVPQRPSLLPATPRDFLNLVSSYSSRNIAKRKAKGAWWPQIKSDIHHSLDNGGKPGVMHRSLNVAEQWGIDEEVWDRPWSSLSGGEAQRVSLAIAIGIDGAEVLLLDEPTSALDAETMTLVEASLQNLIEDKDSTVNAIIWITHSEEQGRRVGTRFLCLEAGGCLENMEMGLPSIQGSHT